MARDQRGFVDTQDNQKSYNEKFVDNDSGPYVGVVKVTSDPLKMGRLGVNIPALSITNNPSPSQVIWCHYLSPFYGGKPELAVSSTDPESYRDNQTSYGFWAVPPDIDTEVLVIFAKGENNENSAYWIGCIQKPKINQQIPGFGSTNRVPTSTAREAGRTGQTSYGTDFLPSGDINRNFQHKAGTLVNADRLDLPLNDLLADQLLQEGLVQDTIRGTTSSSANRESPSRVFGINTPGPVRADSRAKNIGLLGTTVRPDRELGHSLVMDDGDTNGNNKLTRIRTSTGHQILLHDTAGTVYIANGSGNAWVEMDGQGRINFYSNRGISMRTEGDFNLHADKNINFHAKAKINFTAEDNLVLNSEKYIYAMGDSGILSASQNGTIRDYASDGISSFTEGTQLHGANGRIDLAGDQVHFNSRSAETVWGPTWLEPSHDKIDLQPVQVTDIVSKEPISQRGVVNTRNTETTVKDSQTDKSQPVFVTHEPYARAKTENERKIEFVDTVMTSLAAENPTLSTEELGVIRLKLLGARDVDGVINTVKQIAVTDPKVIVKDRVLSELNSVANKIKEEIKDALSDAVSTAKDTAKDALGI